MCKQVVQDINIAAIQMMENNILLIIKWSHVDVIRLSLSQVFFPILLLLNNYLQIIFGKLLLLFTYII